MTAALRWTWKRPHTAPEWRAVLHMPGLVDALEKQGVKIKEHAEGIAPVRTGRYAASFTVERRKGRKRASVRVWNRARHAWYVEYGKQSQPTYPARHVLSRASHAGARRLIKP